jgi:hypothetical protein
MRREAREPMLAPMPTPAAPFPHLDALQALLDRAAGTEPAPRERVGRALFGAQPFVTAGTLYWPWEHAHRVLHEWASWTREMPHDVTSVARIVRLPALPGVPAEFRGRALIALEVAIPREPWIAAGRLAALRRLDPVMDTIVVGDPDMIHPLHASADVPAPAVAIQLGLEAIPGTALDAFAAVVGPGSGANLLSASLQHFGPAHGLSAVGLPVDDEDAAGLEIRLALLAGRLAPFAVGRPAVEDVVRAVHSARPLARRGEG